MSKFFGLFFLFFALESWACYYDFSGYANGCSSTGTIFRRSDYIGVDAIYCCNPNANCNNDPSPICGCFGGSEAKY